MKRRLASQCPRGGRGRVLTAQGQGRRQKLSPKLLGFGRPACARNRPETPKEDLGKRWPRSASTTAAPTKFRGFQHSPWEYGTDQRRPGLPTRSQCREFLRERQKTPHRAKFSLSTGVGLWLGHHPPGDQYPTLGPEGWLWPTVYCQCSKGDVSWRGSAWIWRICQITRCVASLCPKQRSQSLRTPLPARSCALGSGDDIMSSTARWFYNAWPMRPS